jgi:glucose-1-phosphate adenylyltransferase
MDYAEMLSAHKKTKADCTIAVFKVPMEEASRFGIMNTTEDGKVYEFEEKPKKPKSNNASMGIYIFTWSVLRKYLIDDEANKKSENDFGKNIIPNMLNDGLSLYAYNFSGYWKDVGTISSLWESNMDLLDENSGIDIAGDGSNRIYARNSAEPPHFISSSAVVQNSIVSEGAVVKGEVKDSIISHSATIGAGARIFNSIILPGAEIGNGADVFFSIVGEKASVGAGAKIGEMLNAPVNGEWEIAVVGPNAVVADGGVVKKGEMIEESAK